MNERGFIRKLADGDLGLAKTYWFYGVAVGMVMTGIRNIAAVSPSAHQIILIIQTAWVLPVILGTWRSANKYQGEKIWAILAKIAMSLTAFFLVISWAITLYGTQGMFGSGLGSFTLIISLLVLGVLGAYVYGINLGGVGGLIDAVFNPIGSFLGSILSRIMGVFQQQSQRSQNFQPTPQPQPQAGSYCTGCGVAVGSLDMFCGNCGKKQK